MAATETELKELLATANSKLESLSAKLETLLVERDALAETLDSVRADLDREVDERVSLQHELRDVKQRLAGSQADNHSLLSLVEKMEGALTESVSRLQSIRDQVSASMAMLTQDSIPSHVVEKRLMKVAETAHPGSFFKTLEEYRRYMDGLNQRYKFDGG